MPDLKFPQQYF